MLAATMVGCGKVQTQHRRLTDPTEVATVDHKSPFLKAHMRDGHVYILSPWSIDASGRSVSGQGERLDANRTRVDTGAHVIKIGERRVGKECRAWRSQKPK